MITIILIVLFVLGMILSIQVMGALYGLIDLRYTYQAAYPRVISRILVWSVITGGLAVLTDGCFRLAVLWGALVALVLYLCYFIVMKLLVSRSIRLVRTQGHT